MLFLLIVMAIFAVILIAALKKPDEFSLERSALMNASPDTIFEQINNLHKWNAWSPWAKLDPNANNGFEGPDAGVGAKLAWSGNHKVGAGNMTIIESRPNELVRINLVFIKPFKGNAVCSFTLKPQDTQTFVSWEMHSQNKLINKVMSLVMNCEKMVGKQYEQGLANLKTIVEKP